MKTEETYTKIIILFLEKLELLSKEEREEFLKIIKFLNNPLYYK